MTPTDLARLRSLWERAEHRPVTFGAAAELRDAMQDAAPALFDELESLRAEVERLRAAAGERP